ncbi:MAG: hypothetical protein QXF12_04180 [Candidatus Aenigmatarchaeota archaeon]
MLKNRSKIKKIENISEIINTKTLYPSENLFYGEKHNPTYMISIKKNKKQENFWLFNGIYERKLYTRLKNTYIKRALPKIP